MTNVVTFNGKELELINQNNQLYMTLSQIASALEYNNSSSINDILTRNQSEFDDEMTCLIKHGRTRVRIFNREGCWLIGMFARTPKAAEFRKWVLKTLGEAADNKISAPALNKSDIRSALYDYFGEVMLNEEMLPKWRVMFQRWMKDVIFSEDYFGALKKLMIPWVKEAFKGGDAAVWNDFIAMGLETRANALLEAKKKELAKRLNATVSVMRDTIKNELEN